MAERLVEVGRPRRIAFAPRGTTVIIVNQDAATDVYIFKTEEQALYAFGSTTTGGNLDPHPIPATPPPPLGIKVAANGGQVNYVDYPGELYAVASGFATPAGGGATVAGQSTTYLRVLPG